MRDEDVVTYRVALTGAQWREVAAKLANELEAYGEEASDGLREAFLAVMATARRAGLIPITTLTTKWEEALRDRRH
jgi:hypothetical protein